MMRPWLLIAALALAGCQAGTLGQTASAPPPEPTDGLAAIPPCPDRLSATLNTGTVVDFAGAAPHHPDICLRRMNGHTYRYFLGFWGDGWFHDGTPEERAAIRQVLTGPVGTTARFPLPQRTALLLWRSATVTHLGDPNLSLGTDAPRRADPGGAQGTARSRRSRHRNAHLARSRHLDPAQARGGRAHGPRHRTPTGLARPRADAGLRVVPGAAPRWEKSASSCPTCLPLPAPPPPCAPLLTRRRPPPA